MNKVFVLAFSPDGKTVLTGSEDGDMRLWDRATGRQRSRFRPAFWISAAAVGPDGRTVLVGRHDGEVQFWDAAAGKALTPTLPECDGPVWSVAWGRDGKTFLTGSDGFSRLRDRQTGDVLHEWPSPLGGARPLFYPDGTKVLLVAGGFAYVWDEATRRVIGPARFQSEGGIERAAFTSDGQGILVSASDGVTRLWDVATGKTLGPPLVRDRTGPVACCPDGRLLAAGCPDGRITLWQFPLPLEGSAERVRLWVEQLTGMELGTQEAIRTLSAEEVQKRQDFLKKLGGPPHGMGRP
jgi:WD40 repeat protein